MLEQYGWTSFFAAQFRRFSGAGHVPARVTWGSKSAFRLAGEAGEFEARAGGKLWRRGQWPVTGDWVAARGGLIEAVLPRRTQVVRKAAGTETAVQVLAANVDVLFVVTGLDGDFNLRRIERYLLLARESGAEPVIVLNKVDLAADVAAPVEETRRSAPGVPVIAASALTGAGVDRLLDLIAPGRTAALLGSSGAGKSTLINRLLGEKRREVAAVRPSDSRGRHTTTDRQLLILPGGQLLMDLPGLREIQLWGAGDGVDSAFGDLAELARGCRFRDCRHMTEPGCAVRAAVEAGELDPARVDNYGKMTRELEALELPAALAEKRRWKQIHKAAREFRKQRQT
jgi:ribosome biogenesis GTPase